MKIGKAFRLARKKKNISTTDVANRIGVQNNSIVSFECGTHMISFTKIETACEFIGVPMSEVVLSAEELK